VQALSRAQLGLWRVRAVTPGVSIDLEEVVGDRVVAVHSRNVSRGTARWDVLLGRVIEGAHGHELWGPASIFTAAEEDEVVAEIERLARERSIAPGAVFRLCAAELLRFAPASRTAPRSFYTFEGDEVVEAHARWVLEHAGAGAALEAHPDLVDTADTDDGEGVCLEWTRPRRELAARRPELPPGAVVLESSPVFIDPDEGRAITDSSRIGLGAFELRPHELTFDTISVQRLDAAIALVAETLGGRAQLVERRVAPLEDTRPRPAQPDVPAADDDATVPADIRDAVVAGFAHARFQRMLDEPDPRLDGLSPREAARSPQHRPAVQRWLRTLENTTAHGAAAEEWRQMWPCSGPNWTCPTRASRTPPEPPAIEILPTVPASCRRDCPAPLRSSLRRGLGYERPPDALRAAGVRSKQALSIFAMAIIHLRKNG
jgi:hypothetical protein